MSILLIVSLIGWITPANEAGSQFATGSVLATSIEDYHTVFRIDLAEEKATAIYRSHVYILMLDSAKGGDKVIVRSYENHKGYVTTVLDHRGNLLKRMENTVFAVFLDPKGTRMAFTKGIVDYGEPTVSQGAWIYSFATGTEEKICDEGFSLEWGAFNETLYIGTGEKDGAGFIYDTKTKELSDAILLFGGFSPNGKLRWSYKFEGTGVHIIRRETEDEISSDYEILNSRHHGTPLFWMNDNIVMLPHFMSDLEDYLLFVDTGKTLKAPGRVLSVTETEEYVYVCKPGLVIEKVTMKELEVLYKGKGEAGKSDEESAGSRGVQTMPKQE